MRWVHLSWHLTNKWVHNENCLVERSSFIHSRLQIYDCCTYHPIISTCFMKGSTTLKTTDNIAWSNAQRILVDATSIDNWLVHAQWYVQITILCEACEGKWMAITFIWDSYQAYSAINTLFYAKKRLNNWDIRPHDGWYHLQTNHWCPNHWSVDIPIWTIHWEFLQTKAIQPHTCTLL